MSEVLPSNEKIAVRTLDDVRNDIDKLDLLGCINLSSFISTNNQSVYGIVCRELNEIYGRRMKLVEEVGSIKAKNVITPLQNRRKQDVERNYELYRSIFAPAVREGLFAEFFELIHEASIRKQQRIIANQE